MRKTRRARVVYKGERRSDRVVHKGVRHSDSAILSRVTEYAALHSRLDGATGLVRRDSTVRQRLCCSDAVADMELV